ncbi:MAG: hypothetical protein ACOCWA_00330 [Bacteroidota bacterium]
MRLRLFDYKDLNIVEFSSEMSPVSNKKFSETSKYLHGSVFSLIQTAFSLSHPDFSYYDLTQYDNNKLTSLRNHLQDHYSRLKNTASYDEFDAYLKMQVEGIVFLNDLKTFYPGWKVTWENIRKELLSIYEDLLDMIDNCIDDDLVLKVRGF